MITTLIASENFWIILALTLLFIISVFIASSGNEKTRIKLVKAKNNSAIDREETATILIAIAMCIPIFISCCFSVAKGISVNEAGALTNIFAHALALFLILGISLVFSFIAWLVFIIMTIFSYILLAWQEELKSVRKDNKFMMANSALIAAIVFSLSVCITLIPINYFLIILLASSIPSLYLYGQEVFFILKNKELKEKA